MIIDCNTEDEKEALALKKRAKKSCEPIEIHKSYTDAINHNAITSVRKMFLTRKLVQFHGIVRAKNLLCIRRAKRFEQHRTRSREKKEKSKLNGQ